MIELSTRRRTIAIGFGSQVFSRILLMLVSLVSTALLARLLEPSAFGLATAALGILALPSSVFDGALGLRLIQAQDVDDEMVSNTVSISVILALVATGILILLAPALESAMQFSGLADLLVVSSLSLAFRAVGAVARNLLIRRGGLVALSAASVVSAVAGSLVVSCGLALLGFGVWSIIVGTMAATVVESSMNLFQARVFWRPRMSLPVAMQVLRTGGLYAISQALNWVSNSGTGLVIGRVLGATDLGLYSRSNKLLEIGIGAVGEPTMRVLLPSFSRMQAAREQAGALLVRALALSTMVYAVAGLLFVVHSEAIVLALLGPNWGSAVPVVQVLFLAFVARCNYKITESAAFGLGAARLAVTRQAIFAGIALTMVFIGSRFGLLGAAIGTASGLWLIYLTSLSVAVHLVGLPMKSLVMPHFLGIAWGVSVAFLDYTIIYAVMRMGGGFWLAHFVGAATAGLILMVVLMALPAKLLPRDIVSIRAWILGHMSPRKRPEAAGE